MEGRFYVADGSYAPGQVIDMTTTSARTASINFTGTPYATATVVQGANGAFAVEYN